MAPNASTFPLCRARTPLLPYPMPPSLPPPNGGVVRPLRDRRSVGTTTTAVRFNAVVVVVLLLYWLSCWLSCCCCPSYRVLVVATAAAATAKPPTRSSGRHCHGHLHRRCRCNLIRCSVRYFTMLLQHTQTSRMYDACTRVLEFMWLDFHILISLY
jgi:hypothetical protein